MEFIPLAALAFTVMTFVNLLRYAKAQDWNGVVTILTVWASGVGALLLFAQSAWAESITFGPLTGDQTLANMNFASLVIVGLQVGSTASAAVEFKKAFDGSDSAAKPPLVNSAPKE